MNETWKQIRELQLKGDPVVFVSAAKSYIEQAFANLITARGVDPKTAPNLFCVIDQHFDLLPDDFKKQRRPILDLLSELNHMDRELDWYNGDFIDHKKIAADHAENFDVVLALLKPDL
jgi:hypothetical protein